MTLSLKSLLRLPEHIHARADQAAASLLESTRSANENLYAIIDLAAADSAPEWLELLRRGALGRNLFVSQPEATAESLAAWLIPLGDGAACDERLLGFSVSQALLADSVTWLVSPLPTNEAASRLSRRLTARLTEGDALFRFYDPRLLPVIGEEWRAHPFFALGSRWHYFDASFDLQCLHLSMHEDPDRFDPPMLISADQHHRLQFVSELHQLVRLLGLRKPDEFYRIEPERRFSFVSAQRSNAAACGVVKFIDVLRYCEFAMTHGENFHQQADWRSVWDRMRSSSSVSLAEIANAGSGEEA